MIDRLTTFDLMFLRLESTAWPTHFGGLAVVDGPALLDERGEVRLEEVLVGLENRLTRVPKLRQRLHRPGPFAGRPVWVDDPEFDVRSHVHIAHVATPGGTTDLLDTAAGVYGRLLDRRRPLWELWLLVGAADGRVGVLLKLHHSVADGMAVVAMMDALLTDVANAVVEAAPRPSDRAPFPTYRALVRNNYETRVGALRRGIARLQRPGAVVARARRFVRMGRKYMASTAAPANALNQPVRPGRRVRYLMLDVAGMKDVAHAHGGRLNDVVLALWAGGLRALLEARGEPVAGVDLVTAIGATLRTAGRTAGGGGAGGVGGPMDNQTGAFVLPLPVGEPDPVQRLERIVATTSATKARQPPARVIGFLASLAGTPLGRMYVTRQRANNTIVTNVPGPSEPMWFLGAPVREVLPIIELIGNVGLTLCAFSYAGRLALVVTADATAFPDLDELVAGMAQEWESLSHVTQAGIL